MKTHVRFFIFVFAICLIVCAVSCDNGEYLYKKRRGKENMEIHIIPMPKTLSGEKIGDKYASYKYSAKIKCNVDEWNKGIDSFVGYVKLVHDINLTNGDNGIDIRKDDTIPAGQYKIECGKSIMLYASDIQGVNAGFATLLQMTSNEDGSILMPNVTVQDYSESSYRALMVDLARQWHPFEFLFNYIDLCYLYKINYLQLHFTDDQSYTLPCDVYPNLPSEGRSYTKEQIAQLVEYANDRGVVLVPEIDIPGHSHQMLTKYPEVFGSYGIICAEERAFDALDRLLGEVCEMFPYSPYIHIGGDEAAIGNWNSCAGCKAYMKEHHIRLVDDLYTEFIVRATDIIFKHNRTPIVWEGFSKKGNDKVSKDILVVGWESYYQNPKDLLDFGFKVINASWKPLYIAAPNTQWSPKEILEWSKYEWQHWWDKSMAFPDGIKVEPTEQVLGGMICAWGDVTAPHDSSDRVAKGEFVKIRERIPVLSEKTWNENSTRDIEEFLSSYDVINEKLEKMLTYK